MRRLIHLIAALGIALTLSLLGLRAPPDSARAESSRIVVLSGQDLKPYQDVLAGLQQSLTKQGITLTVEVHATPSAPSIADALHDIKKNGARLVVTLGGAATQRPQVVGKKVIANARGARDRKLLQNVFDEQVGTAMLVTADAIGRGV